MRCAAVRVALTLTVAAGVGVPVHAQFRSTSSIDGIVSDDTGSVRPGVWVLLTSSALQVSQLRTVTDSAGRYQFTELPGGIYRIRFDLSQFQPLVRDGLQLSVGFAARVDVTMKVEALAEIVSV